MTFRDQDASLRDELNAFIPRLRRYARALTRGSAGGTELADDLVHATLMRALGARHLGVSPDLAVRLYATLTELNRNLAAAGSEARASRAGRPVLVDAGPRPLGEPFGERQSRLSAGLLALPLEAREALLLVGLEGFDYAQAARILRISRAALMTRLTQARTGLDATLGTGQPARQKRLANPVPSPGPRQVPGAAQGTRPATAAGGRSAAPAPRHLRLVSSRP